MSNDVSSKRGRAEALLDFWFGDTSDPDKLERRHKLWFSSTKAQDRELRERFAALHEQAVRGELHAWMAEPRTALALVLLLDQLSRNLYRGTARAFANDAQALALAKESIERAYDRSLGVLERVFLYMPFEHSESLDDQHSSLELFGALMRAAPEPLENYLKSAYEHAVLHCEIVERFGRFPHRNELLGRQSTASEKQYLEQGAQRFGQG